MPVSTLRPLRLRSLRVDAQAGSSSHFRAACSEMVLLPAFNESAKLPQGQTVSVEFMPSAPGEYKFASEMGMFRGKIVVE